MATQITDQQLRKFYEQIQGDLDIADNMKPSFARDKIIRDVWLRVNASEKHTTRAQRERVLNEK